MLVLSIIVSCSSSLLKYVIAYLVGLIIILVGEGGGDAKMMIVFYLLTPGDPIYSALKLLITSLCFLPITVLATQRKYRFQWLFRFSILTVFLAKLWMKELSDLIMCLTSSAAIVTLTRNGEEKHSILYSLNNYLAYLYTVACSLLCER